MKMTVIGMMITLLAGCSQLWNPANTQESAKKQLTVIGRRCYERGLFWGTGGDISVRLPGSSQFVIKASMTCLGDMDESKMTTVNLDGSALPGPKPSHETLIHARLYGMRPEVGAILHMHSPYATAWASVGKKIPAITQQSVTLLKDMGIVPYHPVGSKELVEAVVACYKNPDTQVVLMENHGVFVLGKDLYSLLYSAEQVENTARIATLARDLGEAKKFDAKVVY